MPVNGKGRGADGRDQILAEAGRRMQTYRERALKLLPWICARCGREFALRKLRELTVHHKDHDHHNNPPDGSNWELLCLYCHDNEHSRSLDAQWHDDVTPGETRGASVTFKPFAGLAGLRLDDAPAKAGPTIAPAGPTIAPAGPTIAPAGPTALPDVRALFREYADTLGVDLCFQGFETELATLPGEYCPPRGALLLATAGGEAVGCVALRPLDEDTGELKRLYVRPVHRQGGLGRRLAQAVIAEARRMGYRRLRLDTLPAMTPAIELYRSLGFAAIAPYRPNPIAGALFMELVL